MLVDRPYRQSDPNGWLSGPSKRNKSPYAVLLRLKPCRLGYGRKTYQIREVLGIVLNDLLIRHTKTCSEPFANSLAHPERNPS